MTITEVAKKYGITVDTLRYYEKEGMIPPVNRNSSGIRDYTEDDCRWVNLVKCMRTAGFSIKALAKYVELYKRGDVTFNQRRELLLDERDKMIQKKREIDIALDRLDLKLERYAENIFRHDQR